MSWKSDFFEQGCTSLNGKVSVQQHTKNRPHNDNVFTSYARKDMAYQFSLLVWSEIGFRLALVHKG